MVAYVRRVWMEQHERTKTKFEDIRYDDELNHCIDVHLTGALLRIMTWADEPAS